MYSGLKFTKMSDKLVAISGLVEAINIRWQWKYVAGLWRESLAYGLCWKREGPGKKSSTYRCPSWSWAPQDSAVRYNSVLEMELEASIINVEVDVDRRNQYGAVTSGSLTLHASLMRGIVPAQKSYRGEDEVSFRINDEVLTPALPAVWMDDDFFFCNEVYCVWLATDWMHRYGLILARTEQERTYRRIGIFEVNMSHTGGWPQIPKSEVVII
ncbi:hypothetical protein F4825DRAFT_443965 [Nemania diffusa]|nr:hypothetical protein F4825DRAFT_443965 [Nemania diffusa]